MIIVSDAVALGIYAIGAYIMFQLDVSWGCTYLVYCLIIEIRVMRKSCIHCYYYDKLCGFGKGKIAALFFKRGDPKKFLERKITWKDLIPDLLVSLIPFAFGILMLTWEFDWLMLLLLTGLFALTTLGNGFVRGNIACKYCKQRELGCPAEKLFAGKKTSRLV